MERRLNADTSDRTGPTPACACGPLPRYVGRRAKRFETVLGAVTLARADSHCAACGQGVCPRDRSLGLHGTSLSPALTRMVGVVGVLVSFQEGSELLRELAGVAVPTKQVERTAEALGREIAADERHVVEPVAPAALAPTLYLGMDGTAIPLRASELDGRAGQQPDGTATTREVKLCTVWSAEARDEDGTPVRDPGSATYSAGIESAATRDTDPGASAFAGRVLREARRRGFDQAHRRAVLGDGAPWIWNLVDAHCPDAWQIVDLSHAKEHLSDVGKTLYGPTSDLAQAWAHKRHTALEAGDLDPLVEALRTHAPVNDEARKSVPYIERNRHRLRYPAFRAQGLCTSTGVVEAGCKVAIGARLKRAGMHWTMASANAIIALRCAKLSGRFEDFWECRAQPGPIG